MEEERFYSQFNNMEMFLIRICTSLVNGKVIDFEKYGPYIEKIRPYVVNTLDNRIHQGLEELVCKNNSKLALVKECITGLSALRDPVAAFCTEYGGMGDHLERTINCLLIDDLLPAFIDSISLNNRLDRICRNLDFLGLERNLLGALNVWNFLHEKDYWVNEGLMTCLGPVNSDCGGEDCSSDLDVEIASGSQECCNVERTAVESSTTCVRPCNEKIDCSKTTTPVTNCRKYEYRPTENTENAENAETTENAENAENVENAENAKNVKLKFLIRKINLLACNCEKSSKMKVAKISIPCKFSEISQKILKIDKSLRAACPFALKRRLKNVCSCLNDVINKFDRDDIRKMYLLCEIRPDYLNFKLKIRNGHSKMSNVSFFATRIPICGRPCKREENPKRYVLARDCNDASREFQSIFPKHPIIESQNKDSRCFHSSFEIPLENKSSKGKLLLSQKDSENLKNRQKSCESLKNIYSETAGAKIDGIDKCNLKMQAREKFLPELAIFVDQLIGKAEESVRAKNQEPCDSFKESSKGSDILKEGEKVVHENISKREQFSSIERIAKLERTCPSILSESKKNSDGRSRIPVLSSLRKMSQKKSVQTKEKVNSPNRNSGSMKNSRKSSVLEKVDEEFAWKGQSKETKKKQVPKKREIQPADIGGKEDVKISKSSRKSVPESNEFHGKREISQSSLTSLRENPRKPNSSVIISDESSKKVKEQNPPLGSLYDDELGVSETRETKTVVHLSSTNSFQKDLQLHKSSPRLSLPVEVLNANFIEYMELSSGNEGSANSQILSSFYRNPVRSRSASSIPSSKGDVCSPTLLSNSFLLQVQNLDYGCTRTAREREKEVVSFCSGGKTDEKHSGNRSNRFHSGSSARKKEFDGCNSKWSCSNDISSFSSSSSASFFSSSARSSAIVTRKDRDIRKQCEHQPPNTLCFEEHMAAREYRSRQGANACELHGTSRACEIDLEAKLSMILSRSPRYGFSPSLCEISRAKRRRIGKLQLVSETSGVYLLVKSPVLCAKSRPRKSRNRVRKIRTRGNRASSSFANFKTWERFCETKKRRRKCKCHCKNRWRIMDRWESIKRSIAFGKLCERLSDKPIDRVKRLIKTKLCRILLDKNKATNTSESLLNCPGFPVFAFDRCENSLGLNNKTLSRAERCVVSERDRRLAGGTDLEKPDTKVPRILDFQGSQGTTFPGSNDNPLESVFYSKYTVNKGIWNLSTDWKDLKQSKSAETFPLDPADRRFGNHARKMRRRRRRHRRYSPGKCNNGKNVDARKPEWESRGAIKGILSEDNIFQILHQRCGNSENSPRGGANPGNPFQECRSSRSSCDRRPVHCNSEFPGIHESSITGEVSQSLPRRRTIPSDSTSSADLPDVIPLARKNQDLIGRNAKRANPNLPVFRELGEDLRFKMRECVELCRDTKRSLLRRLQLRVSLM